MCADILYSRRPLAPFRCTRSSRGGTRAPGKRACRQCSKGTRRRQRTRRSPRSRRSVRKMQAGHQQPPARESRSKARFAICAIAFAIARIGGAHGNWPFRAATWELRLRLLGLSIAYMRRWERVHSRVRDCIDRVWDLDFTNWIWVELRAIDALCVCDSDCSP